MFFTRRSSQVVIESVVLDDFSRLARKNLYSHFEKWEYGVILPSGIEVYNALGSAGDTVRVHNGNTYRSMIQLWKELTEEEVKCYNANCRGCSSSVDGAHVLLSKPYRKLQIGDNVLIIPLCHNCNVATSSDEPIILDKDVRAVALTWNGETI